MINIHKKTLQDLEFDIVLEQISTLCSTSLGKLAILKTLPFNDEESTLYALNLVNEYISSFDNDNSIPNHNFNEITEDLKLLRIENTFLEIESFRRIASLSITANELILFLKNLKSIIQHSTMKHRKLKLPLLFLIE